MTTEYDPVLVMGYDLAVKLGALAVQFDAAGQPVPLVPLRPSILILGVSPMPAIGKRKKPVWLYWLVSPDVTKEFTNGD
jgi:hypothetical protein